MDPQLQTPYQPTGVPSDNNSVERSNKRKLTWGLICLLGPSATIVLTIVLYALINLMSGPAPAPGSSDDMFAEPSTVPSIINIIVYLIAGASTLTLLPGIIIGIVLLASRKK